jgi:D-alanyl-D-alanine carboxypeptidase/D-alanyl-D-alanine-endopeptidase (penicillin-binding protein 4)
MKKILCCYLLFSGFAATAQNIKPALEKAFREFSVDSQLRHAAYSLYVVNAKTGETVFDHNGQVGLAPASTQKIITSITAFELLGRDFRYKTQLGFTGTQSNQRVNGDLVISGSGDPTLGSWRYATTREATVLGYFSKAIQDRGIREVSGDLLFSSFPWTSQHIPDGWIWQDIGNYYGAGAGVFNWRENQFDLVMESGNAIGDPVEIKSTVPRLHNTRFIAELKSAAKGTGDNAYIYLPENGTTKIVRGTIPIAEKAFTISGAITDPAFQFKMALREMLGSKFLVKGFKQETGSSPAGTITPIITYQSPPLDSIIFWFNRRSINLYGEALLKTMGAAKTGHGNTDSGLVVLRKFWKEKRIDADELNMYDGSGLSPLNRVTTHVQVNLLLYALKKEWYSSFYEALPEFNNMKMKSGTINDVKGFCGYHQAKDGNEYVFSFLVNNYSGRASQLVNKMYKVLDALK